MALTWQNLVPTRPAPTPVELRPQDIDTLIRVTGTRRAAGDGALSSRCTPTPRAASSQRNNALALDPARRDFAPRWRSMVTPLSSTGLDLTRDEYLEFWLFQPGARSADSAGVRLVFDLGKVNEDASAIAPDELHGERRAIRSITGRQYVGLGRLDTERSDIGIFNAQADDIGILGDRPDA